MWVEGGFLEKEEDQTDPESNLLQSCGSLRPWLALSQELPFLHQCEHTVSEVDAQCDKNKKIRQLQEPKNQSYLLLKADIVSCWQRKPTYFNFSSFQSFLPHGRKDLLQWLSSE